MFKLIYIRFEQVSFLYFHSGDFEYMTKKYQTEHENANVLEGKAASLEAQFQQQERKNDDYGAHVNDDSDSDIEIIQGYYYSCTFCTKLINS